MLEPADHTVRYADENRWTSTNRSKNRIEKDRLVGRSSQKNLMKANDRLDWKF